MPSVEDDVHEIKNKMQLWALSIPLIAEVYESLVGNKIGQDGGLVGRVKKIENKIDNLCDRLEAVEEKEDQRQLYVKIIWSMGAFIIGIVLTLIARHFLIKM